MNTGANITLRPYQVEAVDGIQKDLMAGQDTILILPTGCGKTVVFAEIARRYAQRGLRTLVVAHRDELIEQARDTFKNVHGILPDKEKAQDYASHQAPIVVASVQTLRGQRLKRWNGDHFDLIIVDEAHHMAAASYVAMRNHFSSAKLLGVTATPDRGDSKGLADYFESIAYQYPLRQAILDGYLVPIVGKKVTDEVIDLTGVKKVRGDLHEADLERALQKNITVISKGIAKETPDRKSLIFLPSVKLAETVSDQLRTAGISSAHLSVSDSPEYRREVLAKFSSWEITHLVNCLLFTEGFDEPTVDCVVMARPTMSRNLYSQMVGRGTRLAKDKTELLLLEFTYNSGRHTLVSPFELFADKDVTSSVRERAERNTGDMSEINLLNAVQQADAEIHSISDITKRLHIPDHAYNAFDPLALADLAGVDFDGEMSVQWEGRKLSGPATPKQVALLNRFDVETEGRGFDDDSRGKARASALITLIADNGWKIEKVIENLSRVFKNK